MSGVRRLSPSRVEVCPFIGMQLNFRRDSNAKPVTVLGGSNIFSVSAVKDFYFGELRGGRMILNMLSIERSLCLC